MCTNALLLEKNLHRLNCRNIFLLVHTDGPLRRARLRRRREGTYDIAARAIMAIAAGPCTTNTTLFDNAEPARPRHLTMTVPASKG